MTGHCKGESKAAAVAL
jgi:hypothetical protein